MIPGDDSNLERGLRECFEFGASPLRVILGHGFRRKVELRMGVWRIKDARRLPPSPYRSPGGASSILSSVALVICKEEPARDPTTPDQVFRQLEVG